MAGAALAALGDVLLLGRRASGADFDQAVGVVPEHIEADATWRSLWNGAGLSRRRIWAGTLCGVVGIPLLAGTGLRASVRAVEPGALRDVSAAAAGAFAVSGVLTHAACGAVVLAYRREVATVAGAPATRRPSPGSVTRLLGVSTVVCLGSLAVMSSCAAIAALSGRSSAPTMSSAASPFPCVGATLLTFGLLPYPLGGYARPASISTGLLLHFCFAAASARLRRRE